MRSFRWHPALAMALVAAGVVTACETVPYTGRSQLQFMSPEQESQLGAQAWGLILMAKAAYDPRAARDLWVRMAAASPKSGKPPEFLSTHPSGPTRIQQIHVWMAEARQDYHPR